MDDKEKSKNDLINEVIALRAELEKSNQIKQNASKRELFLHHVLSASLCGIYIYNIVEGHNDYINPQYTNITGWTINELNTMSKDEFASLFHPEERYLVFAHMEMIIQDKNQDSLEIEYRFKRKDGRWIWCLSRDAAFHRDSDGSLISFIGTFLDITKRKQTEKELQKMNKLKSVGILAGGIAHNFNNILMGLFGNISIAKSYLKKDQLAFQHLEEAEESMNRTIRLTKQLLIFSKGGEPVKEEANLNELVKEIVRFDLSSSNVKPVFGLASDLWLAKVDKGQIQQVFSNLTINADQAMPNGGHIYIILENAEISPKSIPNLKSEKYIKVTVRDEGPGIKKKHLEQIFDPYYTTKQAGSGLGLTIVYSIIDKHGGKISVNSQLGQGTTFTFYLPASLSKQLAKTKKVTIEDLRGEKESKVLVMDDEEIICKVASSMLEKEGYEVKTASHGEQALIVYKEAMDSSNPFELVILDLTIHGGMGGLETMEHLLAIDPQATVVVSSGYSNNSALSRYKTYGFKDILPKPYTFYQLQNVLNRVLKK